VIGGTHQPCVAGDSTESDIAAAVRQRCEHAEISARSVLVTILGDSVLPVTKTLWLSSLFELAAPFGFSERLVRTSMFRLVSEGWVSNERVGRRSRYSLTLLAVRESENAERRIYAADRATWDGSWTFAVLDTPQTTAPERDRITRHLRWHGFVTLGRGLLASPSVTVPSLRKLLHLVEPASVVPIGRAELDDLDRLVDEGFFADAFRTDDTESAYRDLLARYEPWLRHDLGSVAPLDAYGLRTMLVHEFRRIRLRAPDVPAALLPPNWAGDDAFGLAADLYRRLSPPAARALGEILEVDYPATMPRRFET
jgi:phenylacetic acid degradation operon negative regulatory protein